MLSVVSVRAYLQVAYQTRAYFTHSNFPTRKWKPQRNERNLDWIRVGTLAVRIELRRTQKSLIENPHVNVYYRRPTQYRK